MLNFEIVDNCLYISGNEEVPQISECENKDGKIQISEIEHVVIAEGVPGIGSRAFFEMSNMLDIVIPSSVKEIGSYAFFCCERLLEVDIPDSVKRLKFGAFAGCQNLYSLRLPRNIEIEDAAFIFCNNIVKLNDDDVIDCLIWNKILLWSKNYGQKNIIVPREVEEIAAYAFLNNENVESIGINDNVKNIRNNAFDGCINLKSVTDCVINDFVIWKDILINPVVEDPYVVIPKGVKKIGNKAFEDKSMNSVCIASSVEEIGESSFEGCEKLEVVKFEEDSKIKVIKKDAFRGCINLISITLPNSIEVIEDGAFDGCSALKEVNIPDNVCLKACVFHDCENLKVLNGKEINNFLVWKNTLIDFLGNEIKNGEVLIPDNLGITTIGNGAFYGNCFIKKIIVPEGVKVIQKNAFSECIMMTEISLPSTLEKIETLAFFYCRELMSVDIPDSVKIIEPGALRFCIGLKQIKIPKSIDKNIFNKETDVLKNIEIIEK